MEKKGFYISKQRKGELVLNIFEADFVQYLEQCSKAKGWVKFRIYEREKAASNGLTHNMELIQFKDINTEIDKH
jgi:hypothetical protein